MTKLSAEQVDWACRKREAGWSTKAIGRRLDVSAGTINYHCLKHGAISPRQRRSATPADQACYVGRDGRRFRTFTASEDERLLDLARKGTKLHAIARAMQRAPFTIRMRLMLLELRPDLPEREA